MNNRNVYMHGFVCDDAALFLDTHPDCPHARHLYQENAAQYNQARKQYAAAGKPLFRTDAVSDRGWTRPPHPSPGDRAPCQRGFKKRVFHLL